MPDYINEVPKLPPVPEMDPAFQIHYQQMIDSVNGLLGFRGTIPLQNHINLNGSRITNLGSPAAATDALSSGVADNNYSASTLRPYLESSGKFPMRTMRRLNDKNQREQTSSFLNDIPSSVPNANQVFPTITNSGGGVSVSIPAALFMYADGSQTMLQARTDLLSLPAQYAINTISSSGTVVTVATVAASGIVAGQVVTIAGVTPSSFNGTVILTGATPPYTLFYQSNLGTVAGSGGFVQTNAVWYYCVAKRSQRLILLGAFTSDNMQNRINANLDGLQIVAVVTLNNSGGQIAQSGGGGTPITGSPTAGSFF